MAVGDAILHWQTLAQDTWLTIQPASGDEWCLEFIGFKNDYAKLEMHDGSNFVQVAGVELDAYPSASAQNSMGFWNRTWVGNTKMKMFLTNTRYIRIMDDYAATNIWYVGYKTKD